MASPVSTEGEKRPGASSVDDKLSLLIKRPSPQQEFVRQFILGHDHD